MSLSPGIPVRPAPGTVVLEHKFLINQATIVDLSPDTERQGVNVFKTGAITEAATVIAQSASKGVAAATTGDSGFHVYNTGYPGDKDISCKLTLPADNDIYDVVYKSDGLDMTDTGTGYVVRVQGRLADSALRFRVRRAILIDGTVAGVSLDGGSSTNDVTVADETAEFTLLVEDRVDKVSFYLDGTFVDSYTYDSDDLAIINGTTLYSDGTKARALVEIGITPKDANVVIDDLTVTIR